MTGKRGIVLIFDDIRHHEHGRNPTGGSRRAPHASPRCDAARNNHSQRIQTARQQHAWAMRFFEQAPGISPGDHRRKTMRALTRNLAIAATLMSVLTGTAFAETPWQHAHPRRVEVNHRLAVQNHRIHREVREGEMSHAEAARLHRDDHKIRQEERDMASQDRSHLTKPEQHVLNQQENATGRQIGQ
jgi:hypothetical protein